MPESETTFIPAGESKGFIFLFDLYVRNLFRRRFKNIAIHQQYQPGPESKTIYYLNHTSWWDGLIPLLLNRRLFRQNARAMMEEKQMLQYRFFRKIGAFSVNTDNPRDSIHSLRYAVESLQRPRAALFIYPEGKIVPFSATKPTFKKGLGWISNQCPEADVVPVGIYIHTAHGDKPELYIRIGKAVQADHSLDSSTLNEIFEEELGRLLVSLRQDAHEHPELFKKV